VFCQGVFAVSAIAGITDGERNLRFVSDGNQFSAAQQARGGDYDSSRLHYAEPARDQHRMIRTAQQDAITGDQTAVLKQKPGNAVGAFKQPPVGPGTRLVDEGDTLSLTALDSAV